MQRFLQKWVNCPFDTELYTSLQVTVHIRALTKKTQQQKTSIHKYLPPCSQYLIVKQNSVAKPHHFYAAPAPGVNFDAAPAPTLLYSKAKFLKRAEV
jgi:hypothetical protein